MKAKRMITCLAIVLPIVAFSAMPVNANEHNPPSPSKGSKGGGKGQDLLEFAQSFCPSDGSGIAACALWLATEGENEGSGKCQTDTDGFMDLKYTGRHCDLNEETLKRDAATVVRMTDEAMNPGDDPAAPIWCEVKDSLDSYMTSFNALVYDEGKLEGDAAIEAITDSIVPNIYAVIGMYVVADDCETV